MKSELILKFEFEASHSLSDYEVPHPHIWRLEISVSGVPIEGRIIDIVALRGRVEKTLKGLTLTYLNENSWVDSQVRASPTCETLSQYFYNELSQLISIEFLPMNSSLCLESIEVAICDMDRNELGSVRLSP